MRSVVAKRGLGARESLTNAPAGRSGVEFRNMETQSPRRHHCWRGAGARGKLYRNGMRRSLSAARMNCAAQRCEALRRMTTSRAIFTTLAAM